MYKIFNFCLMMLLSVPAFSQCIVEGRVVDERTKQALQGVNILAENSHYKAITDSNGYFSLEVADGEYVFRFSLNNYIEKRMPVSASGMKITLDEIYLEPDFIQEAEQLVVISESELEDDESGADVVSGLLQSSQDVFMRRAAFDFSSVFFKPRGYDSKDVTVLINGIPMNRIENGRAQWANWGGLNDVTRSQELSHGIVKSDYTFGGMSGSNYINIRPSLNRPGLRLSTSAGNRSYAGRIMATYNSGMHTNGFAYSLSASRRWAANGSWVDGTLYNAYSFFGALEYQLNKNNSLSAIGMFSPIRRGKTSPITREVIDLVGYQYNPYWGKQNGDIRNSRNKIVSEPIFILSYNY